MKVKPRSSALTWKSTSRKARAAPSPSWRARLESVSTLRATFVDCHRAIAQTALGRHLPRTGRLVEVGAGLGQLAHWYDASEAGRWIHTEPELAAMAELQRQFPQARTAQASIEALPFERASCAGVVALCLFDLVRDLPAALAELRRILEPGGVVIHLLDLAPDFAGELRELARSGHVVLPNLFADPSASHWPEDLLVTQRTSLQPLLATLASQSHPLLHVFGHYFANFAQTPFDAAKAAREYEALLRDSGTRELLKTLLASAYTTGFQLGLPPPQGALVSSAQRLAARLETAARREGFAVEVNDIRSAWVHAPRSDADPIYRSLALGHERRASELPERLLCSGAVAPPHGHALHEAAMSVLVLRSA
jgi:SAM-dependent methyltransferase